VGAIAIIFWSSLISLSYFKVMAKLGRLRISKMLELLGLDIIFEGIIQEDIIARIGRKHFYASIKTVN